MYIITYRVFIAYIIAYILGLGGIFRYRLPSCGISGKTVCEKLTLTIVMENEDYINSH